MAAQQPANLSRGVVVVDMFVSNPIHGGLAYGTLAVLSGKKFLVLLLRKAVLFEPLLLTVVLDALPTPRSTRGVDYCVLRCNEVPIAAPCQVARSVFSLSVTPGCLFRARPAYP